MFKEAENWFIVNLWPANSPAIRGIWIGVHDPDNTDTFVTVDGSNLNWTYWRPTEPTHFLHGRHENAVHIGRYRGGQWNDVDEKGQYVFACTLVNYN